jgi:hypothetical protein
MVTVRAYLVVFHFEMSMNLGKWSAFRTLS